jgi:phosphoenolpyruvate carboxykinase (ATP)
MKKAIRMPPTEVLHPFDVHYMTNPSQEELRKLAVEHTLACWETKYGGINKISRNKARFAKYTYLVAPDEDSHLYSGQTIPPEKAMEYIQRAWDFIHLKGKLIEVQAYYGLGEHTFPIQWFYTLQGANVAGMQQTLSFPREEVETPEQLARPYQPVIRLVYCPDLPATGMPGDMAMIVDLDNYTTYVLGADYFGESKKGALRMLNEYVYQLGGLVLHAGAKAVTVGDKRLTMTILGLSGTGKTTTTFSKQGELTQPIQDDMVCVWPGGNVSITENGAFAKTYGLTHENEPIIWDGTLAPSAWVENSYLDDGGTYDFWKQPLSREDVKRLREELVMTGAPKANVDAYINGQADLEDHVDENMITEDGWDFLVWTQNGRSIFPLSAIPGVPDLNTIPPMLSMGMLDRDEGPDAAFPGIVKFKNLEQAAAYFMLGETTKTSAAGKDRGRIRSPFTQPFFPRAMGLQAVRFAELAEDIPGLVTWMMNTGWVGGDAKDVEAGTALKVKIKHSSAMLEAMLRDEVVWKEDPDFGYLIVDIDHPDNAALMEKVPKEILNPITLFEEQDRMDVYRAWVKMMLTQRKEFLEGLHVADTICNQIPVCME